MVEAMGAEEVEEADVVVLDAEMVEVVEAVEAEGGGGDGGRGDRP